MRLIVSSPDGEILRADQVDWFNIKLADGYPISIYKDHAPLVALTSACSIKYRIEDTVQEYQLPAGILSVSENMIHCWINGEEIKNHDHKDQAAA